jgi:hypothetical protein
MVLLHNGIYSATVAFPDRSESRLTSDIPDFQSYTAFGDFSHIKTDCRNHVLRKFSRLKK